MGSTVAERSFYLDGDPHRTPVLTFRFWKPVQLQGEYPRCAYELAGSEGAEKGEVSGVDFIDCIVACLSQAGTKIAGLNESIFGGRLRWEASPEGGRGLGLPTIEDHWPFHESYRTAEEWARNQPQRSGSESG